MRRMGGRLRALCVFEWGVNILYCVVIVIDVS